MSSTSMTDNLDDLIAQLESYSQSAQAQVEAGTEQNAYWRGVRFGVELALLEARKRQSTPSLVDNCYAVVSRLVFDSLDKLIMLCQVRIQRDLLVYNARLTRYELLKAIRQQATGGAPNDYERQANPDAPIADS